MDSGTYMEKQIREPHIYRKLFTTCFMISACTFGGGMVIMSLLQKKFVEELKWISQDEMMDLIAIAQSCPGVMAVNSAIIIGYRTAGAAGAFITLIGTVLPPMIILSVISMFYRQFRDNYVIALLLKGMQAGVAAVLIHTTIMMCRNVLKDRRVFSVIMLAAAVYAAVFMGVDIILIILACGCAGGIMTFAEMKKEEGSA